MEKRRAFLQKASLLALSPIFMPVINSIAAEQKKKPQKILLRSSWQTVNIGDIGHTFGMLTLFEQYLPEVEVILWPKVIDRGVDGLLKTYFPKVKLVQSKLDATSELKEAFNECTLMLHGSGPFVTANKELKLWWDTTKKPFGIYGVSLDEVVPELAELLNHASFIFCRDTESLRYLKTLDIKCPVQEFGPDATFSIKVHNEPKAKAYLDSVGLKEGEFICVIPRLRYTPYWQMNNKQPTDLDKERYAISLAFKEIDALKLRNIITDWVNTTGLKVLLCPEVTYQVELSKETIYDRLPDNIKKNVVWRDNYWLPDEAISVYKRARAMLCFEPHSLIMAVANGIPSIHLKQPSDTRKGQMWRDIGLGDWYFLIDETPASQISSALLKIHNQYPDAVKRTQKAMGIVVTAQKENIKIIKKV